MIDRVYVLLCLKFRSFFMTIFVKTGFSNDS